MFRLEIETGNDAFTDNPGAELARILAELSAKAWTFSAGAPVDLPVRDVNGNRVGFARFNPAE